MQPHVSTWARSALAVALVSVLAAVAGAQAAADPASVVRAFYRDHFAHH